MPAGPSAGRPYPTSHRKIKNCDDFPAIVNRESNRWIEAQLSCWWRLVVRGGSA
jgi:hypothetical protein